MYTTFVTLWLKVVQPLANVHETKLTPHVKRETDVAQSYTSSGISKTISVHVLLQYQSRSYYIIGQEVYYSIGRFYYIIGQLLQYRAFLLHYRAVITVSGVYYIIGWYTPTRIA